MGSIGKVEINLRETCKKTKFTLPSPITATLTITESDSGDDYLTSYSDDDDITIASSNKAKEIHVSNSTPKKNNPL